MQQKITEEILSVGGMSCSACELRIEKALNDMAGILEVSASFSKGQVRVVYDAAVIDRETICNVIRDLDYTVGTKASEPAQTVKAKNEKPKQDGPSVVGIVLIIAAIYFLIQNTVGFGFINNIPEISQNMSYGLLFVVGLFTSIHCLAMCGGINLSQCVSYQSGEANPSVKQRVMPSLLYNAGRVISYTVIGGIVGALGSVVSFSSTAKAVVTVFAGVFMLIMGLNMLNVFPWLRKINIRMPKFIGKKLYSGKTNRGPFVVGLLNGLMPCGPLQAMQLYALGTGSFYAGAFSMLMFSLGTVPLMFTFGAVSSFLSGKFTHKMMRVSAVLVMLLGVLMVSRGMTLSGVQIGTASAATTGNAAVVNGGTQEITTSFDNGYYVPITVKKGVPVKWTVHVTDADLNGCNNPVTIPAYNIQKKLVPGDNVIEFTPTQSGTVPYSCWMGMIRSTITVVDDDASLAAAKSAQAAAPAAVPQQPSCCVPRS